MVSKDAWSRKLPVSHLYQTIININLNVSPNLPFSSDSLPALIQSISIHSHNLPIIHKDFIPPSGYFSRRLQNLRVTAQQLLEFGVVDDSRHGLCVREVYRDDHIMIIQRPASSKRPRDLLRNELLTTAGSVILLFTQIS